MNNKKTTEKFNNIYKILLEEKIAEAIILLKNLIKNDKNADHHNSLEKITETYKFLLQFYTQGVEDPARKQIRETTIRQLFELTDLVRESIFLQDSSLKTYEWKRQKEKYALTIANSFANLAQTEHTNESFERLQLTKNTFTTLWFTDKYTEAETKLVKVFFENPENYWDEKAWLVSGITLSLLRCFDAQKFELLSEIFEIQEDRIWQRALVGLLISLYVYDKRLDFYPQVVDKVANTQVSKAEEKFDFTINQLIKTKETENIAKKFREEILPEMVKFRPQINDKLDLDEIISESLIEDENPDWEKIFGEDSENLMNKMEEFSMLQMEGADVLISAFSQLKDFNFFKDATNWFAPFYKENINVKNIFDKYVKNTELNSEKFLEGLEKSSYICSSDKYSFCLNLERMPDQEQNMVLNLFNLEINSINELDETDNLSDELQGEQQAITQYVQDLYRFFKLSPAKKEFNDIFSKRLDIHNRNFYEKIPKTEDNLHNIAELYFSKKFFDEAIETYKKILKLGESEAVIYEKIGFSYQKMGDYKNALDYYHKAEFFDTNKKWLSKKIAFCNLKLNNLETALQYYQQIENEYPDDLHTQTNIGHCYLHMENYEEALKHYFKVEFFAPSNIKVMRPIAWCSLIVGKLEQSISYYKKLLEKEPSKYDFINLGHAYLCINNKKKAIKFYKKGFKKFKDIKKFSKEIKEDFKHLQKNGVSEFDIKLMLDLTILENN